MTIEINKEQIDWLLTQAYTKMSHKRYDDSLALLRGLVVLVPENPDVYRMLAYTLLQTNQPEESLKMVDIYLQHLPSATDDEEIHWIKGRAKLRLEKAATKPPQK